MPATAQGLSCQGLSLVVRKGGFLSSLTPGSLLSCLCVHTALSVLLPWWVVCAWALGPAVFTELGRRAAAQAWAARRPGERRCRAVL